MVNVTIGSTMDPMGLIIPATPSNPSIPGLACHDLPQRHGLLRTPFDGKLGRTCGYRSDHCGLVKENNIWGFHEIYMESE